MRRPQLMHAAKGWQFGLQISQEALLLSNPAAPRFRMLLVFGTSVAPAINRSQLIRNDTPRHRMQENARKIADMEDAAYDLNPPPSSCLACCVYHASHGVFELLLALLDDCLFHGQFHWLPC